MNLQRKHLATARCAAPRCNPGRHLAGCDDDTCPGRHPRPADPGPRLCANRTTRIRKQLQEIPATTGRAAFITGTKVPPLPLGPAISARPDKAKHTFAETVSGESGTK